MRVVVCIKQVPDTTRVEIDPKTNTLVREGVRSILNPLDTFALEAGLRIRDELGGTVTALTMGPPQAEQTIREAIALGVDDGALVCGREFAGSDTWSTSYALAGAIRTIGPVDLILCGKQAIDGDTAQVGPELAVQLALPQATYVRRFREIAPGHAILERLTDRGFEVLRVPLPAVLTVVKELNEPRLPNLEDLRRGRFAALRRLDGAAIGADAGEIGLDGSPTRVVKIFTPESRRSGRMYRDNIERGIDEVAGFLEGEGLL